MRPFEVKSSRLVKSLHILLKKHWVWVFFHNCVNAAITLQPVMVSFLRKKKSNTPV